MDSLKTAGVLSLLVAAFASPSFAAGKKPVNVSGTWAPKYWTLKIALQQDGERVVGASAGAKPDHFFRGQWDGGRLILVGNKIDRTRKRCEPRGVFALVSKGTVTRVESTWFKEDGKANRGPWTRATADAGDKFEYPWLEELQYCGMLRTYELAFKSGSDALIGEEWPILAALGELMKKDPALKIEVAGHTDSTGDAAKNQTLSEQRAAAVKKALVEKYGVDEARVATRGWGAEQPVQENKTEDGRAVNRRVEIVIAR